MAINLKSARGKNNAHVWVRRSEADCNELARQLGFYLVKREDALVKIGPEQFREGVSYWWEDGAGAWAQVNEFAGPGIWELLLPIGLEERLLVVLGKEER